MNEPSPMRMIQCIGELDGVAQQIGRRQRSSQETLPQRQTLEILHDQEPDRLRTRCWHCGPRDFTNVVEIADVRMIERRHGAGLAFEARPAIRIDNELFREDFDGDRAVESCVSRAVDLTHATGSNQLEDFIRSEANAGRERHGVILARELYGERWRSPRHSRSMEKQELSRDSPRTPGTRLPYLATAPSSRRKKRHEQDTSP